MIKCKNMLKKIHKLLDREIISETVEIAIKEHISQCQSCKGEYDFFLKVKDAAGLIKIAEPSPALFYKIKDRIRNQETTLIGIYSFIKKLTPIPVAIILFLFAYLWGFQSASEQDIRTDEFIVMREAMPEIQEKVLYDKITDDLVLSIALTNNNH